MPGDRLLELLDLAHSGDATAQKALGAFYEPSNNGPPSVCDGRLGGMARQRNRAIVKITRFERIAAALPVE
jgi:hypothetical protein